MNPTIPHLYDPATARQLAALAASTYSVGRSCAAAPMFPLESCAWKTTTLSSRATDTLVIVSTQGEDCVVAFRGTQDLRNWLTDLDCKFTRPSGPGPGQVHRGFHEALESIRPELEAELQAAQFQRLWLTGHSLGGALAMLFARTLQTPIAGVYTFGQPRVGDANFRDDYDRRLGARTFRVLHSDDVVPRVPWLLGAYRHAGHEAFYPLRRTRSRPWDNSGAPSLAVPYLDLPWPAKLMLDIPSLVMELSYGSLALLADHHVSRYQALFSDIPNRQPNLLTR